MTGFAKLGIVAALLAAFGVGCGGSSNEAAPAEETTVETTGDEATADDMGGDEGMAGEEGYEEEGGMEEDEEY